MLTYNNWIKQHWRKGKTKPKDLLDNWILDYDVSHLNRNINFKDSVEQALTLISEKDLPLVIMYSGGLDSEVILKTALDLNIEIKPYTLRYLDKEGNYYNKEDLYYVREFSKKYGLSINYIDLDIEEWMYNPNFPNGYSWFIETQGARHVGTPLCCWARMQIEKLEGECCVIQGQGDCPLNLVPDVNNFDRLIWKIIFEYDGHYRRFWWYQKHYPNDVPQFYLYIPELHYSYLNDPILLHCVKPSSLKCSVTSSRHAIYHYYWPELKNRKKYTGFENLNFDQREIDRTLKMQPWSAEMILAYDYEDYIRKFAETSNQ